MSVFKLGKKIKLYFKDVKAVSSAESEDEFSTSFKTAFNLKPEEEYDKHWYDVPVKDWEMKQVNGWLYSNVQLGHRAIFSKEFYEDGFSTGDSIEDTSYVQFHDVLRIINDEEKLSISFQVELLVYFGYLKRCLEQEILVDRHFPIVFNKVVENLPMEEYNVLLNVPGQATYYGEQKIDDMIKVIVCFVSFIVDSKTMSQQLEDFFRKKLKGLEEGEELSHQMKLIVIDQVVGGGSTAETAEQMVLKKKARKFLSPIVSMIPFLGNYGIFHIGVSIGDDELFVEWTTSSIILLTKLYTQLPVITLELDPISVTEDSVKDVVEKIVGSIYKYNTSKSYNLVSCNCQHFVIDFLKALCLKPKPVTGAFKKFMRVMRNKGESEMVLDASDKFRKKYSIDDSEEFAKFKRIEKDRILFSTHKEIDEFALLLCKSNEEVKKTPEWDLLRAFDQTLWIKYFNTDTDSLDVVKKCKYLEEETEEDEPKICCPFIDASDHESSVYKKIVKRNEEFQKEWYEQYLTDLETGLTMSMKMSEGHGPLIEIKNL